MLTKKYLGFLQSLKTWNTTTWAKKTWILNIKYQTMWKNLEFLKTFTYYKVKFNLTRNTL